jgi:hypothetical protein
MDNLKLVAIAVLTVLVVLLWLAFLRHVPDETGAATIVEKSFRGPRTYTQEMVGAERGLRGPSKIPLAESYAFKLQVDGTSQLASASFNLVKSRQFELGQRVAVRYVRRGLPPLWQRILVLDITPLEQP